MNSAAIYVSIGQSGVQKSHASWELLCMEHGITCNGQLMANIEELGEDKRDVFFYEAENGRIVPRSVVVDTESSVIDEIRTGAYRDLHNPLSLVSSYEDCANNFGNGRFCQGLAVLDKTLQQIRRHADRCDIFQGFFFSAGLGGGTGSGYACLLLEQLDELYAKSPKVMVNIFPGPTMSTAIVEPYNIALSLKNNIEYLDLNITLDNEAAYRLCRDKLSIPRPNYNNVNRLMAQVNSAITCSLRFPSTINMDLNQLQTNLVPFPRIHFPLVSQAPIVDTHPTKLACASAIVTTAEVFTPENRLVTAADVNTNSESKETYMACSLQFRGKISPLQVNQGIARAKKNKNVEFVDWCPTGFKAAAKARWSILRRAILRQAIDCEQEPHSVRRFHDFGLFTKTLLTQESKKDLPSQLDGEFIVWTQLEKSNELSNLIINLAIYSQVSPGQHVTQRLISEQDNTGNVCVWPSEEVLSHYLCELISSVDETPAWFRESEIILELGGGMSCLAGIVAAKLPIPCVKEVILTDGNERSCRCATLNAISNSPADGVTVSVRCLPWATSVESREYFKHLIGRIDLIMAADCLFFESQHQNLLHLVQDLLHPTKGVFVSLAPRRGESLSNFMKAALECGKFHVDLLENYSSTVWQRHLELVDSCQFYSPDLHFPLMLTLRLKVDNA